MKYHYYDEEYYKLHPTRLYRIRNKNGHYAIVGDGTVIDWTQDPEQATRFAHDKHGLATAQGWLATIAVRLFHPVSIVNQDGIVIRSSRNKSSLYGLVNDDLHGCPE